MPRNTAAWIDAVMRAIAHRILARVDVRIEGAHLIPPSGPVIIVCRHQHHLYDGAVLVARIARPVRIVAGLDWARSKRQRAFMELLCRLANWPVVLRDPKAGNPWGGAYQPAERRSYARSAIEQSVDLLRRGDVLVIFPEGSPEVDPHAGALGTQAVRPFFGGHLVIAERARRGGLRVALVPAGFTYCGAAEKPHSITLRFGAPEYLETAAERAGVARKVEDKVRALSA